MIYYLYEDASELQLDYLLLNLLEYKKTCVTAATFKQTKEAFNKIAQSLSKFDIDLETQRGVDRCYIKYKDNHIIFAPVGNGDKIRGLRSDVVYFYEPYSIAPEILDMVMYGLVAPLKEVK